MTGPAVLVHGFGTSSHMWRPVVAGLRGALTPDLPGFGRAAAQGQPGQGTADMAAALAGYLRDRPPVTLVGHSMGGKVALLVAARWPDRVARLILVAPSPPTPEPMPDEGRAALRAAHGDAAALRRQYAQITRQPLEDQDLAQLIRDGQRASPDAWVAWPDVGSREDIHALTTDLRPPVTVLFSEDDPAIRPDVIRREVLARLPHAQARPVSGSGHLLPLERPDLVLAALRDAGA
ncbi:alpha/beta fold hydrolase [Deinococcus radiotolerans]|uniref:Hydrolase n=1 Tax=Deinococcus radiotolerans TaxID=1309407 RepID=A0ABQ2FJM6_9DEIO|nr:alpha/beta hydrolase [Deinococcus radiotolerans]GGK99627.1 hydrolase [Deinococcus radiotolerans]